MYSVELVEPVAGVGVGDKAVFFAPWGLHRQIDEGGYGQGDVLTITRVGEGRDTRWRVKGDATPAPRPASPPPVQQTGLADSAPQAGARRSDFRTRVIDYMTALSLSRSVAKTMGFEQEFSVNAAAFTLLQIAKDFSIQLSDEEDFDWLWAAIQELNSGGDRTQSAGPSAEVLQALERDDNGNGPDSGASAKQSREVADEVEEKPAKRKGKKTNVKERVEELKAVFDPPIEEGDEWDDDLDVL